MNGSPQGTWTRCLFCTNLVNQGKAVEDAMETRKEKLRVLYRTLDVSFEVPENFTQNQFPFCQECNSRIGQLFNLNQYKEKHVNVTDEVLNDIELIKKEIIEGLKKKEFAGVMTAREDLLTSQDSFTALPESILKAQRLRTKEAMKNFDMFVMKTPPAPTAPVATTVSDATSKPVAGKPSKATATFAMNLRSRANGAGNGNVANAGAEAEAEAEGADECVIISEVTNKPRC